MGRWSEVTDPKASGTKSRAGTNKGAARRLKTLKRQEAEHRNDATPYERTAAYRRSLPFADPVGHIIFQVR